MTELTKNSLIITINTEYPVVELALLNSSIMQILTEYQRLKLNDETNLDDKSSIITLLEFLNEISLSYDKNSEFVEQFCEVLEKDLPDNADPEKLFKLQNELTALETSNERLEFLNKKLNNQLDRQEQELKRIENQRYKKN